MGIAGWKQLDLIFAHTWDERKKTVAPSGIRDDTEMDAHRRRVLGYLTMRLTDPVDLVFTNNRSTMISFRRAKGRLLVRLHRMFRHADGVVLNHLSSYLMSPKKIDSHVLNQFIAQHRDEIRRVEAEVRTDTPLSPLLTEGRYFDLKEVFDRVNKTYFGGRLDVRIGWGGAPRKRRGRRSRHTVSRALATYYYNERMVKVSPVLDSRNVPIYVIDWIVYHELLHHVLPVKKIGGKHIYHSHRFRALERAFVHYEKAKAWEASHIDQLLL